MAKQKSFSLEEEIKNYGNKIKTIKDDVEKIRQTPDVMIGKVANNAAFLTMTREIVQNAFDEILKGVASSPYVFVTYDELSHTVTVEDNGRGIPHGMIDTIFGHDHSSSNYDKKPFQWSAGKNGCGGFSTNALSHKFTVTSFVLGKGVHAEFVEGHIWKKGEVQLKASECTGKQGSIISFVPNEDIIGQVTATWHDIYRLLMMITPSTPLGTTVEFTGIDKEGKKHIETIQNKDGVITYLIMMTQKPYVSPICISAQDPNGIMKMDFAFTYDTSADSEEEIISLNNTCPTTSGTHVDGALDGLTRWFRNYMNKIYLANSRKKLTCTANDIRNGLKLAISTFHIKGIYNGQAKEILGNPDMVPFVSQSVQNGLNEWSKSNQNDLQKVCKWIKESIELRLKTDKEKEKISKNYQTDIFSGYPDKYLKPNGHKYVEFFIVEGDSAFGSARDSRNAEFQGIYPIRGKIANAMTKSRSAILNNAECSGILNIIGGGYGKNFDLSKVKVDKVIIMSDADPDGAHIRTLLLVFLALYCRPLVEAGMVYAVLPPLYGVPTGRGKDWKFFADDVDFIKWVQHQFCNEYTLGDVGSDKTMSNKELVAFIYRNRNYIEDINNVATYTAIDPLLLETLIQNKNLKPDKLIAHVKKQYRFMNGTYDEKAKTIIFKGLAGGKDHEIYFNDHLLQQCENIIPIIRGNKPFYNLNGVPKSPFEIMQTVNGFMPPKLSRFKGLGEMDPSMLATSTLDPENRTLIRYTFDDIVKSIDQMRYINSNKNTLLSDLGEDE